MEGHPPPPPKEAVTHKGTCLSIWVSVPTHHSVSQCGGPDSHSANPSNAISETHTTELHATVHPIGFPIVRSPASEPRLGLLAPLLRAGENIRTVCHIFALAKWRLRWKKMKRARISFKSLKNTLAVVISFSIFF